MSRPRAYEDFVYPWSFRRVPKADPARTYGVFVVHGIGLQDWTDTAATLRSGFEDALVKISKWQVEEKKVSVDPDMLHRFPPPFILDGYWSNYIDLEKSFPEDWKAFSPREREFFSKLWAKRNMSRFKTIFWFFGQQLSFLSLRVLGKGGVSIWSYFLYWVVTIVSFPFLIILGFVRPKIVTGFMNDVRLYAAPDGIAERAIVQRIDYRVGKAFLYMIGLDWDFNPLPKGKGTMVSGERADFKRIVWVAHSLGTVISYNVISDLCHRAIDVKASGTPAQKKGAKRFLSRMNRFVTLGSPLDKFAFLYKGSLRPWPDDLAKHLALPIPKGQKKGDPAGFWVNFFSAFDPVSGSLDNQIYKAFSPRNFHIRNFMSWVPAVAHIAYWTDQFTLSYILSRTAGQKALPYKRFEEMSAWGRRLRVFFSYLAWVGIFGGGIWALVHYRVEIYETVKNWIVGIFS